MDVRLGLSPVLRKEIVEVILRHCDPDKIVVYGSRARGDYNRESDIDIAIDCVSPRGRLKEAFRMGLIDDEETVLRMLEDRNMTAYT
jgi:predicted nucleotidyltransferase